MATNSMALTARVAESFLDYDPEPFNAAPEVRRFLKDHKCNSVLRARIPDEVSEYLQRWADCSDKTFISIVCRIVVERVLAQRELGKHGLRRAEGSAAGRGKAKTA